MCDRDLRVEGVDEEEGASVSVRGGEFGQNTCDRVPCYTTTTENSDLWPRPVAQPVA